MIGVIIIILRVSYIKIKNQNANCWHYTQKHAFHVLHQKFTTLFHEDITSQASFFIKK